MNENRKIIRDGFWVAIGQIATAGAAIVGVRIVTEVLNPNVYGSLALLLGIVALAQNATCSPLNQVAFRFHADMRGPGEVTWLRRKIFGWLVGLLGILALCFVGAGLVFGPMVSHSAWTFFLLGLLLAVDAIQLFEIGLLSAARRQRAVAVWRAAVAWGRPIFLLIAVWVWRPTVEAALLGYSAAVGLAVLAAKLSSARLEGEGADPTPPELKGDIGQDMLKYGLPLIPLALVGWVTSLGDRYFLGGLLGMESVGIYAAAYGLIHKPFQMAEGLLSQTLLPAYNRAVSEGNEVHQSGLFRKWILAAGTLAIVGVASVYILRIPLTRLCLAEPYRQASQIMPWLALGFAVMSVGRVFEWRLYAMKRTRAVLCGHTLSALAMIGITIPFILRWGIQGAAAACPLYCLVYACIMLALNRSGEKTQYQFMLRFPSRHSA